MVGPSLKLDQIESESDVIFKALVISSSPLNNPWFEQYPGFAAYATKLKIISVIKDHLQTVVDKSVIPDAALKSMSADVQKLLPR